MSVGMGFIAIALASMGCYTIKTVTFDTFGFEKFDKVWVTRSDQSVVLVERADISGGTLRGYINLEYVELAPAELQTIKVRKLSQARTVSLVAGGAAAFIGVAIIVSGTDDYYDPCVGNRDNCGDGFLP